MDSRGGEKKNRKEPAATLLSLPICAWTWSGLFRLSFLQLSYIHCCFDRCCQRVLKHFWFAISIKGRCELRNTWKQQNLWVWHYRSKYFLLEEWRQCFLWKATTKWVLQQKRGKCSQMTETGIWFVTEQHAKIWLIAHHGMLARARNITPSLKTQERSMNTKTG